MRPLMKMLYIAVLVVVIGVQASGMPSAQTGNEDMTSPAATAVAKQVGGLPVASGTTIAGAPSSAVVMPTVAGTGTGGAVAIPTVGGAGTDTGGAVPGPVRWTAEVLLARVSDGVTGYSMATGQAQFHLPPGKLTADGRRHVSAEIESKNGLATTRIGVYDSANAGLLGTLVENGSWALGVVSANGKWAALARMPDDAEKAAWTKAGRWQSEVQVFDGLKQNVGRSIKLDGNFELDAVSNDGSSFFLIEHVPAVRPEHYRVRLFNVSTNKLLDGALVDKTSPPDEVMTGYAWGQVGSPGGHWLLTLYMDTVRNSAFVHAIDLQNQFALCIDLPSGTGDFNVLKQYALTLAPSGNKLYASNAALGVVVEIGLTDTIGVRRTQYFSAAGFATPPPEATRSATARGVMSRDGSKLYFSSGWDVWNYDTTTAKVDGPILSSARIAELGLSADGARLYLAWEQGPMSVIATANGAELRFPEQ